MTPLAFVPNHGFFPRTFPAKHTSPVVKQRPRFVAVAKVKSADAMEFFQHREGKWDSWRVTHHLAFKRSESGESRISMQCLDREDERIISLCKDWDVDPSLAQGGCYVTWRATMAWDQEGENHEGSTVFALVPEDDDIRKGKILRDRGYAEIVPIAGTYFLDENDNLNLETPYEGGAVDEQFAFDGPDVVNRVSTVRRFGGFSTATFSTERRVGSDVVADVEDSEDIEALFEELSFFGGIMKTEQQESKSTLVGANRFGDKSNMSGPAANSAFGSGFSNPMTVNSDEKPSVNSAFGSGFGGSANGSGGGGDGISEAAMAAAQKAGIDLSKIPPSMREDFVASFNDEGEKGGKGQ